MCATIYAVSPILRLKRSSQSGNKVMTAAWQTVYSQNQAYAWIFGSGRIDLTNMAAGDSIEIRVSSRQVAAGGYIVEDLMDYDDVQPVNKKKVSIGSFIDTFGVIIEMRQTAVAVAFLTIYVETSDATR